MTKDSGAKVAVCQTPSQLLCGRSPPHSSAFHYNMRMDSFNFTIAGRQFRSRLIVGTGKYKSGPETARALAASGAEMVTVAVRRVNLDRSKESLLDYIDPHQYFLLPNTDRKSTRLNSSHLGISYA